MADNTMNIFFDNMTDTTSNTTEIPSATSDISRLGFTILKLLYIPLYMLFMMAVLACFAVESIRRYRNRVHIDTTVLEDLECILPQGDETDESNEQVQIYRNGNVTFRI